jgi:hypothetical protein
LIDGKGKGALKAIALRWQIPFDHKGPSMAKAKGTFKAN